MRPAWLAVVILSTPCAAQETPPADGTPPARDILEPLPPIEPPPYEPPTDQEAARIRALIDDLMLIERPDCGLSATLSGVAFAPIPQLQKFSTGLIQVDHDLQASTALVELVRLGPRAMPFLLEALTDARPTRLKIKHDQGFGGMWPDREIGANPANGREWAAV